MVILYTAYIQLFNEKRPRLRPFHSIKFLEPVRQIEGYVLSETVAYYGLINCAI